MNAGRELDAVVAEKVMGWDLRFVGAPSRVWTERASGTGRVHEDQWSPSTSIHDAWKVFETLTEPTIERHGSRWSVTCVREAPQDTRWIEVDADTAPLAICLAALTAVGVEVPA